MAVPDKTQKLNIVSLTTPSMVALTCHNNMGDVFICIVIPKRAYSIATGGGGGGGGDCVM